MKKILEWTTALILYCGIIAGGVWISWFGRRGMQQADFLHRVGITRITLDLRAEDLQPIITEHLRSVATKYVVKLKQRESFSIAVSLSPTHERRARIAAYNEVDGEVCETRKRWEKESSIAKSLGFSVEDATTYAPFKQPTWGWVGM